jgi:hypothetical protein
VNRNWRPPALSIDAGTRESERLAYWRPHEAATGAKAAEGSAVMS